MLCGDYPVKSRLAVAVILALALLGLGGQALAVQPQLVAVKRMGSGVSDEYEGRIEAVTETRMAAQVTGLISRVHVGAGDRVRAGQLLLEIDSGQARQQQAIMQAGTEATRAQLQALNSSLKRQQELFAQNYISQAALESAQAQQRAVAAKLKAEQARVEAARIETEYFAVRAPYDGIIIDVSAMQGDMAMPGMPLLRMFDPAFLRVGVSLPVGALPPQGLTAGQVQVGWAEQVLPVSSVQLLPVADAASQTARLRLGLEQVAESLLPGQTVRVQVQGMRKGMDERLFIPASAVIRRAEVTAVYVQSEFHNAPVLRQIRLGNRKAEEVEVLSGLREGERLYLDPHAAGWE